jgi:hypothetical protein
VAFVTPAPRKDAIFTSLSHADTPEESSMAERRQFSRIKKRYLVDFQTDGRRCSGITHDLSPNGLFVCSTYFPKPGTALSMNIKVPDGQNLMMSVKVVRSYRVPQRLVRFVPSGFSVRFERAPEEYFQLLARLYRIAA